jgi:hypothetical protein
MTESNISAKLEDWRRDMAPHLHLVPHHQREGVVAYIMQGRQTGHFLSAVFSNDLREAVARADENSLAGLKPLVQFMHNYSPPGCWGSPKHWDTWRANGGLAGALRAGTFG